jgi:hypothetical protein
VTEVIAGPSGGVLGTGGGPVTAEAVRRHPDLAKRIVQIGCHPRAGHDRRRWESVNWDDYRAKVGVCQRAGPWRIEACISEPDTEPGSMVSRWLEEAHGLPVCPPGVYTALLHDQRGLVMSDVPAEIAGALPFLDWVAAESARRRIRVLIGGLGLGIVPAWLLTRTDVAKIDVVEIDPDVTMLVTGEANWLGDTEPYWADDPRLSIYPADVLTWRPHPDDRWHAVFMDVWDLVSAANLPAMHRLTRRYARHLDRDYGGRIWCWERPECEAMRRRGQTLERPWPCFVSEDGY